MLLNDYNTQRNVSMMPFFHLHSYNKQFYLAMLILLSMLISQTTAMLSDSDNGNLDDKRMASASSSKLNEQQQQQIPSSRRPFASEGAEGREQFEGSGSPNPDDEDGDTGEGSGDGFEGSGIPPAENGGNVGSHSQSKEQDIRAKTNVEGSATGGINNLLLPNVGDRSDRQSTTMKAPPSPLSPAIHPNAQPPTTQAPALTTTTSSTKTTTTVTSTKATTAATTPRQKVPFTTARTTTTSTAVPRQHTTAVVLSKAKTPPPYLMDPTGPLDRLKPGLFAIMIGGSVCLLLFLILVVTYVLYRIRKKDEGSYTCEEPIQPHYSYAYQKASIKEFYA